MTIPLVTPADVKEQQTSADAERQRRVIALADEESRLARLVNEKRAELPLVTKEIDDATQKMRNEYAAESVTLEVMIAGLEQRKAEAMKPVTARMKELDVRESDLVSRETSVEKREKDVKMSEERLAERTAACNDREQTLTEREGRVEERETRATAAEKLLSDSNAALSEKWATYHEIVAKKEREFSDREMNILAADLANDFRAEGLDKKAVAQASKDREIADRYETLISAEEEKKGENKNFITLE